MRVNFVSRGHGYGHAARDLRIMAAMRQVNPGIQIRLASAGSGADYYRSRGVEAVDLGFDDADDMSEAASWRVWRFLYERADADLVVSDEFLTVPGFCRHVLDVPNVLITDWFFAEYGQRDADSIMDDALEVVVPDFPEAHPVPPATTAPVWFCGPLVDAFAPQRADARKALGLDEDALVMTVAAGGRPDRIAALRIQLQALQAWSRYAAPTDQLLLLADPPPTRGRAPRHPQRPVGRADRPAGAVLPGRRCRTGRRAGLPPAANSSPTACRSSPPSPRTPAGRSRAGGRRAHGHAGADRSTEPAPTPTRTPRPCGTR
ncbi:hypothetical protein SCALM49S_01964 [Streptomyces californicus]